MNVVVLLKQVPDTESLIEINADASDIKTDNLKWIMNPYDELAVEEGIRIREKQGSGKVTVLSLGPERATAAIRTALAMGADEGLLINDHVVLVMMLPQTFVTCGVACAGTGRPATCHAARTVAHTAAVISRFIVSSPESVDPACHTIWTIVVLGCC